MKLRVALASALLCFSMCFPGGAIAGTTGGIIGTVVDSATGAPVAGVRVTVQSPSQTESTNTDGSGRFAFVSLAPDTYTISTEKNGYENTSSAGMSVFADQQQTVVLRIRAALKTIASITSRSAGDLVRPGTT